MRLAMELLEHTAGRRRRCRRCRSFSAENTRKRGRAWSVCTPYAQAIKDDARQARDRPSTAPAMLGVPDRHRPQSWRPDLRRRLPKCALAAVAQLAPPGTLIQGGVRWPNHAAHEHDSTRTPRATYQDVLDTPEHRVAEIVNGTLYTQPRPHRRMRVRAQCFGGKIGNPFDYDASGPGGWWIIDEPELHLGSDILVPDLAGWRRERMVELPDTDTLAPDWVCEVLSASTRRLDLHEKRPVYAREGIGHLWLIDPVDRTLEAFELREGQWLLIASAKDDPVSIRPFDAITFSLADLWP